jgi:hypothetical protein
MTAASTATVTDVDAPTSFNAEANNTPILVVAHG